MCCSSSGEFVYRYLILKGYESEDVRTTRSGLLFGLPGLKYLIFRSEELRKYKL